MKTDPPSHQRFFRFSYLRPYSAGLPHIHELRDGDAFAELAVVLAANGYDYGGLLLNYRGADLSLKSAGIKPTDVIVLTTRPPLNDNPEMHRLFIEPSDTELEKAMFAAMDRYFSKCSRVRVILANEFACNLKHKNRGDVEFSQYGPACYTRLRNPCVEGKRPTSAYKGPKKTAAFLVRTRMEEGPELLVAFSLDGPETLTWCHLLRTRYAELLMSKRFVMAEITFSDFPTNPATLAFVDDFEVDFLLNQPLE